MYRYPFDSEEAQLLNKQIFETIYYGAMEASCELAKEQGPYETYEGCPVSKGVSNGVINSTTKDMLDDAESHSLLTSYNSMSD